MTVIEEHDREAVLAGDIVSPVQLAHLVLRTSNYEQMADFYARFLNARIAFRDHMTCFLRFDHEHHRLVILAIPGLAPVQPRAAGMEHFSFTYGTLGGLLANYVRLGELGIKPDWSINHGFTTSIYYRDPDGNLIETQFDNMTLVEADAFMAGDYFAKNPIGVDFDPEVLVARYRNGDPVAELVKFRSAPYPAGKDHIRSPGMPPYDADGELL